MIFPPLLERAGIDQSSSIVDWVHLTMIFNYLMRFPRVLGRKGTRVEFSFLCGFFFFFFFLPFPAGCGLGKRKMQNLTRYAISK